MEKLKIGVSACLLGQNVRYNGGHQLNHFIRDILGQHMDFVPVCPEVECGMPRNVGTGMFARAFTIHFPLLPVEEDGRL